MLTDSGSTFFLAFKLKQNKKTKTKTKTTATTTKKGKKLFNVSKSQLSFFQPDN